MTTRDQFERAGDDHGVDVRFWGVCGKEATERVEGILGVKLPQDVQNFAQSVGNVLVGPFDLIVCGDEKGELSCATETVSLRERHLFDLFPEARKLVKILEDAETSFFCNTENPHILCYETRRIMPGEEIHSFASFDEFLGWLFEQAKAGAEDT